MGWLRTEELLATTAALLEREHKSIVVSLLHVRPESPAVHGGHHLGVLLFREGPEHKPLPRSPSLDSPFAILKLRRYAVFPQRQILLEILCQCLLRPIKRGKERSQDRRVVALVHPPQRVELSVHDLS